MVRVAVPAEPEAVEEQVEPEVLEAPAEPEVDQEEAQTVRVNRQPVYFALKFIFPKVPVQSLRALQDIKEIFM